VEVQALEPFLASDTACLRQVAPAGNKCLQLSSFEGASVLGSGQRLHTGSANSVQGLFVNPWASTWQDKSLADVLRWVRERRKLKVCHTEFAGLIGSWHNPAMAL